MATGVLTPEKLNADQPSTTASLAEEMVYISMRASEVDAVDYARECIRIAESEPERARRCLTEQRRAILEDNWKHLVYADMKERVHATLHPFVLGQDGRYCDTSRNPCKAIWGECAVLYKGPAQRVTPEVPEDAELYRALTRGTKFHTFWSQAELELYFFNDLILWPTTITKNGKGSLSHNKRAGDTTTAIFDSELGGHEPYALVFHDYWHDGTRQRVRYIWWTPQWRAVFDDSPENVRLDPVTLMPIGDEVDIRNPYGRMIFSYLHLDPYHESFWNLHQGDELVETTLKIARQLTQTTDLYNRSSHRQLVTTGKDVRGKAAPSLADPGKNIMISADGTTQIVDWAPDFLARQEIADNDEARAGATYGINKERLRRTSYQSADAAQVNERPLEEKRQRTREPLSDAERDHRDNTIVVVGVDRLVPAEEIPNPDVWMEVIHAPIAYPGDPGAQLAVDEKEIGMGLTSTVDVMQRRYPGISKKEAQKRIEANIKLQAKIQKTKQVNSIPAKASNRSAEDEESGKEGPAVRDNNGPIDPGSPPGNQEA